MHKIRVLREGGLGFRSSTTEILHHETRKNCTINAVWHHHNTRKACLSQSYFVCLVNKSLDSLVHLPDSLFRHSARDFHPHFLRLLRRGVLQPLAQLHRLTRVDAQPEPMSDAIVERVVWSPDHETLLQVHDINFGLQIYVTMWQGKEIRKE